MKFTLIKSYKGVYSLRSTKDSYILVDYTGITFLDKETLNETGRISDFYNGITDNISHDRKYFMLGNISGGNRVYDTEKRTIISDVQLNPIDNMVIIGITEGLDGKSYYVFFSDPEFAFAKCDEKPDNVKVYQYSFPDFKEGNEVTFSDIYYDAYSSKMINGYLMINNNGEIDFMDEEKRITKHPEIQYNDVQPIFNENRGEIYITSEYGLRVYDRNLIECNKFDIISDTKKEVSSPLISYMSKEVLKDRFDEKPSLQPAERIAQIQLLDENHICAFVVDTCGTYSRILVIDIRNGNIENEFKIGIKASEFSVLDEKTISFFVYDTAHILRIEE